MDTFVIRIWMPSEEPVAEAGRLRGIIEHVSDGSVAIFESSDQLLAFVENNLKEVSQISA
jgi:hypothetical protein